MNYAIDFEFVDRAEPDPRIYCCVIRDEEGDSESYWTLDDQDARQRLRDRLAAIRNANDTLIAYAASAEARCMLALGLDPLAFNWIDLHYEFRLLTNHSDRWRYGKQWKAGNSGYTFKNCKPPQPNTAAALYDDDENPISSDRPACTLVNAIGKFLDDWSNPNDKDHWRELILQNRPAANYSPDERAGILAYCSQDVSRLHELYNAMTAALKHLLPAIVRPSALQHQLKRGRWAADLAKMERVGIPITVEPLEILGSNYELLIDRTYRDLVETHYPFYEFERGRWIERRERFIRFLRERGLNDWPRTPAGFPIRDEKTLKAHEYIPEIAALRQAKKITKQAAWYRPEAIPEFLAHVGTDGRLRVYQNGFGTQSGRNAPPAKIFIPAQSKWLRSVIRPEPGRVLIAADYKSQEFHVAACLTGDRKMQGAYASGDVYIAFGKDAGLIPPDGTSDSHPRERQLCKSLVLGLQYGMGAKNLAARLSADLKEYISVAYAQILRDKHRNLYAEYWSYLDNLAYGYKRYGLPILICDGWALWNDNPNPLSVKNIPIQGASAAMLRAAVRRIHDAGICISYSHHDAVYVLATIEQAEITGATVTACMVAAAIETVGSAVPIEVELSTHQAHQTWIEKGAEDTYKLLSPYLQTALSA